MSEKMVAGKWKMVGKMFSLVPRLSSLVLDVFSRKDAKTQRAINRQSSRICGINSSSQILFPLSPLFFSRRDAETQRTNRKSSIANCLSQILSPLVSRPSSFVPFLLLLLISTSAFSQHRTIDWKLLAKVEWSEKYSKEHDETFYYPKFGKEVLAMNGQPVQIKGYVIPVDVETGYFVLSANPFASCFFCGQAGPESILELQLKEGGKKFKTDDVRTFKGTLRLNYEDLMHCNYILENAEVVK